MLRTKMQFLRLLTIIESQLDPFGDTLNWDKDNDWDLADKSANTGQSVGPRSQMDFKKLYNNNKKFISFASWYHNSRGNWNDVLSLSKQDPEVNRLVQQAMQEFERSQNPTSSGDGLYAKFGNQLEELVEKKMQEKDMGVHKYTTPDEWTDEDIFGSSASSQGQMGNDGISQRLSNLEQSYSDLLRQFNDLKNKLSQLL